VVLAGAVVLLANNDAVKVTPVVSEGRVLATFAAPAAWTDDARELVRGGLELKFSFDVELRRPAMLLDATLARVRMVSSVKSDTLTGAFQVSKSRDGRLLESTRIEEPHVREWMTAFQQVLLEPAEPLEPNVEYYVRVRLFASPRRTVSLWSLWPFGRDDGSGRAAFTFIR
jgi:hypothetical protein